VFTESTSPTVTADLPAGLMTGLIHHGQPAAVIEAVPADKVRLLTDVMATVARRSARLPRR
jgi:hypothetical protein